MVGTTQVLEALRGEGFKVSHSHLGWLIRDRIFIPQQKGPRGAWFWGPGDAEGPRHVLRRRGRVRVEAGAERRIGQ